MYLEKIQSPEDVKKLDVEQLKGLAGEMSVRTLVWLKPQLPCTMYLIHQRIKWYLTFHIRVTAIKC